VTFPRLRVELKPEKKRINYMPSSAQMGKTHKYFKKHIPAKMSSLKFIPQEALLMPPLVM